MTYQPGRWSAATDPLGVDTVPKRGVHVGSGQRRFVDVCDQGQSLRFGAERPAEAIGHRFGERSTIDSVRTHIALSCLALGRRPPALDDVAPATLMAHVVRLGGPDGLTRRQLVEHFGFLDEAQMQENLAAMLDTRVVAVVEDRPNHAGSIQQQTVYRCVSNT